MNLRKIKVRTDLNAAELMVVLIIFIIGLYLGTQVPRENPKYKSHVVKTKIKKEKVNPEWVLIKSDTLPSELEIIKSQNLPPKIEAKLIEDNTATVIAEKKITNYFKRGKKIKTITSYN